MNHKRVALGGIIFVVAGLFLVLFVGGCAITGCFDGGPSENGTPTPTTEPPTTNPTTDPPTRTETNTSEFDGVEFPDGTAESGIDASVLSTSHSEYMRGTSNTFDFTLDVDREDGASLTTTEIVESDTDTVFISSDLPNGEQEIWSNDSIVAKATDVGMSAYFSVSKKELSSVDTQRVNITNILRTGNYEANRVIERENETFIVYDETGMRNNSDSLLPGDSVSDYSSTVIVSLDGYIKGFSLSYNTTYYGSDAQVMIEGIYSKIGNTTPTKPGWVSPAIAEQTQLEKNSNEQYTSLFHLGGRDIPEGTTLEIKRENGSGTHTVKINETFERGDVIYLYDKNGTVVISQSTPTGTTGLESGEYVVTGYKHGAEVVRFALHVEASD